MFDWMNQRNRLDRKLHMSDVTSRFCGECPFLSMTEREQNKSKSKQPHICKRYKEQVRHNGHHPELPVLDRCEYEG